MATRSEGQTLLRAAVGDASVDFRDGQWEAIDRIVNLRGKVLCVQRCDLWRDERLRGMAPNEAAGRWLEPVKVFDDR